MSKRILSLAFFVIYISFMLFGCNNKPEKTDRNVIIDNTITIDALLPADSETSELIKNGIFFAGELANSVNIGENINIDFGCMKYNPDDDIVSMAQSLIDNGSSAIIYSGNDYNTFKSFTTFIDSAEVPVISLCPYTYETENFFSLTLSPQYLSSCVATYTMDKGYKNPLIIFESTNDYYLEFSESIRSTFANYTGNEPKVMYKLSGDTDAYSKYSEHDFIFLVTSENSIKEDVSDLRNKGYIGEIMLNELMDKSVFADEAFYNCTAISKFEVDISNNVATVFSTMYAEANNIGKEEISPAIAYGYDAFMLTYEALKSFEPEDNLFSNNISTTETEKLTASEIMLSDLTEAIKSTKYMGVTDVISFTNNKTAPSYIYVDNISISGVLLEKKYTFS